MNNLSLDVLLSARAPDDLGEVVELCAELLRCSPAHVRAIWRVESGERFVSNAGRIVYRFEPHLFWRERYTWRQSLAMDRAGRLRLEREAFAADPERFCRSCSWGVAQVLGLHSRSMGYASAVDLVRAWGADPAQQARDWVRFLERTGLDLPLRLGDWQAFARGYNGSGNVVAYSAKIARELRALGAATAPVHLSIGARGPVVEQIQRALGLDIDGWFGPATDEAVRLFQAQNNLAQDGIVGALTYAALLGSERPAGGASAAAGTPADSADLLRGGSILGVGGVLGGLVNVLPGPAGAVLPWLVLGVCFVVVAVYVRSLWRSGL